MDGDVGVSPPLLTFQQLIDAGDLSRAVDDVDDAHALGQVHVVGERARQLDQQRVQRAETLGGNGAHQPGEVAVSVPVEADLFGSFLRAERLERARAVQAAVRAVGGAWDAVGSRAAPVLPLYFISCVEVFIHVCWRELKAVTETGKTETSPLLRVFNGNRCYPWLGRKRTF